ncbi:MarC family protein [Methanocorpusculum vombati]|uniref:UPF0056 membrane protein n=1 Tax=Methanocorpusculum vombati TaxID=3002864 RepID=A0ABT4ILW7_9EURY|nr:MarC family protein [Methanocorpusculum vombati]MCZ9319933.1 hypothetical protein [Methanocorpusculum sp.]MCZ0862339.1 hypothetical protein [Methanocorpusculum vombati]MDE2519958.1 hypothetical protein [Methanocorpusculum sp.]MDE2546525.1 hypothetical protein [Methanocorpusculum sp.]MDE2547223.1 hypothetical protein [Methanocorpusculum sp.]
MEFIAVVIMLFLVESALWNLPVFQVLTQHLTPEQYTREALVAVIITFILMMLTALGGQYVLDILGVSLEGINIGGGIIILYMGFQMIVGHEFGDECTITPGNAGVKFAVPFLFGTGVCSIILTHTQAIGVIPMILAIGLINIISFVIIMFGIRILRKLGSFLNLLITLSGLYIVVVGTESIMAGVRVFLGIS